MPDSTLDITGEEPPVTNKGHGTRALGPSDSSDSGSDVVGGAGLSGEVDIGLDRGTTEDPDSGGTRTAGPDLGDAELDSDSDRYGTGERAAAGRDTVAADGGDISVDTVKPAPGDDPVSGKPLPPSPPDLEQELDIATDDEDDAEPND